MLAVAAAADALRAADDTDGDNPVLDEDCATTQPIHRERRPNLRAESIWEGQQSYKIRSGR